MNPLSYITSFYKMNESLHLVVMPMLFYKIPSHIHRVEKPGWGSEHLRSSLVPANNQLFTGCCSVLETAVKESWGGNKKEKRWWGIVVLISIWLPQQRVTHLQKRAPADWICICGKHINLDRTANCWSLWLIILQICKILRLLKLLLMETKAAACRNGEKCSHSPIAPIFSRCNCVLPQSKNSPFRAICIT